MLQAERSLVRDTMRKMIFFSTYLILPAAIDPGIYSAYTRSRTIMFLGNKAQPVRRADNLTAIREPFVYTMWDP
jgi:hypothetical protein